MPTGIHMNPRVERLAIIQRLERTYRAFKPWADTRTRPPGILDDFFNALADAGMFNRAYPELAIPPMRNGYVPRPILTA